MLKSEKGAYDLSVVLFIVPGTPAFVVCTGFGVLSDPQETRWSGKTLVRKPWSEGTGLDRCRVLPSFLPSYFLSSALSSLPGRGSVTRPPPLDGLGSPVCSHGDKNEQKQKIKSEKQTQMDLKTSHKMLGRVTSRKIAKTLAEMIQKREHRNTRPTCAKSAHRIPNYLHLH